MSARLDLVDEMVEDIKYTGGNPLAIVIPRDEILGEPGFSSKEGNAELGTHKEIKVWDGPWREIRYINKKGATQAKFF